MSLQSKAKVYIQRTKAKDSTASIRVACIGDSITELSNYPNQLANILGDQYIVGNFGACGTTVLNDSGSPYRFTEAHKEIAKFQPDIIISILGTNDASPSFEHNLGFFVNDYVLLLQEFKNLPSKPEVFIANPPPIFSEILGLDPELLEKIIIPAITETSIKTCLPVIAVHSAMNKQEYFFDGVHPSIEGARVIAQEVYKSII